MPTCCPPIIEQLNCFYSLNVILMVDNQNDYVDKGNVNFKSFSISAAPAFSQDL